MSYEVRVSPHAQRQLRHLRGDAYLRLQQAIDGLTEDPRPHGCMKMKGRANAWRIRVGTYRVVYTIQDSVRLVRVDEVGHRAGIY